MWTIDHLALLFPTQGFHCCDNIYQQRECSNTTTLTCVCESKVEKIDEHTSLQYSHTYEPSTKTQQNHILRSRQREINLMTAPYRTLLIVSSSYLTSLDFSFRNYFQVHVIFNDIQKNDSFCTYANVVDFSLFSSPIQTFSTIKKAK